jgi:hypothetical protein
MRWGEAMNDNDFEDIAHDAIAVARRGWFRLLKAINGIAITLGGIVIWVHASYPQIEAQLLGGLPAKLQFLALGGFGVLVHAVTSQASKAAGK